MLEMEARVMSPRFFMIGTKSAGLEMTPDEILQQQEHRPWPVPRSPWIMRQTWNDLLFAHWSMPAEDVSRLLPRELELDLFDGKPWVAVTLSHDRCGLPRDAAAAGVVGVCGAQRADLCDISGKAGSVLLQP
jgi:hypothetical protein